MPRKIKRPAARSGGLASRKRSSRPVGNARRVGFSKRSPNTTLARQRAVRKQAIRRQAKQTSRLRPQVRPAAAPRKIMPKRSAPVNVSSVSANRARRMARPKSTPTAQVNRLRTSPKPHARPRAQAAPKARSRVPAAAVAAGVGAGLAAAAFTLNTSRAHPDLASELSSLQYELSNLEDLSSFDDLTEDLNQLDRELKHALDLLESARERGYRYQGDLDQLANAHLGSPTAAASHLRATETTVNDLLRDVNQIRGDLHASYSEIERNVLTLTSRLTRIHWALSQLEEARFKLEEGEHLVMAVKNRLDKEGKDDPEGILFLTDRRLIFERKEKVATKKVLFITTEKELVQELVFAEPVASLSSVKSQSKGLFGHQDFLEVSLAGASGVLSLHLDGQDSDEWANLIQKVQSGKITAERAVAGGLSYRDLMGDLTQADILSIQSEVNQIQDELMLANVRQELEELENEVHELTRDLGDVRARGYAIESGLEADIAVLGVQWERVKGNADKTLELQSGLLAEQAQKIQGLMSRLAGMSGNLAAARPVYMQLKSALASAEAQAAAAEETVYSQFDDYADEVEGMDAHLDWVDWMLDALSTASFRLMATESGVSATEAVFALPGREPENGVLYLTDQRLLWEDRIEEYELKVDVPLAWIETVSVKEQDDGAEYLIFKFSGQSPLDEASFLLSAPVGEDWQQKVGRARSGDYAADRALEVDPAEIERVKNAPTQCSNCGAAFTAPVLRGQVEITCEFCGTVTRI
jgi:hypothetical protein